MASSNSLALDFGVTTNDHLDDCSSGIATFAECLSTVSEHHLHPNGHKILGPNEDHLKHHLTTPISIQRNILLTENFYPLDSHSTTSENCSTDDTKQSSSKQLGSTIGKRLTRLMKSCLSNSNSNAASSSNKKPITALGAVSRIFPIVGWLSRYRVQRDLFWDVITGLTVLALHIPQGLAYGKLAGVDPVYGLYVSIFPVFIYAIFGGSRQISIGTFAVISITCKDVIEQVNRGSSVSTTLSSFGNSSTILPAEGAIPPMEILTSLCLLVGLIQIVIGALGLGVLATLLSDPLISAYCFAVAIQVFASQMFTLFGIDSSAGPDEPELYFDLVKNFYRLISRALTANLATMVISALTIAVLASVKNLLEPYLARKFKLQSIVIPIDISMIIFLTLASKYLDFGDRYGVALIPKISGTFAQMPVMPRVDLWPQLLTSATLLSFIIYASTFSLEKMYAQKHGYSVSGTQELLALGLTNLGSAFFMCYPSGGSLSRSSVQDRVGGKTQLASIISATFLVVFMVFLSGALATLPLCALACILVVALQSIFGKASELIQYWSVSKADGVLWFATAVSVLLFGVDMGLLYALAISLALVIVRLARPSVGIKFAVPHSECYLSGVPSLHRRSSSSSNEPNVTILSFHGPLMFLNIERFLGSVRRHISDKFDCESIVKTCNTSARSPSSNHQHSLIFDMSSTPYIDGKAVQTLLELEHELATEHNVRLYLACVSRPVLDTLVRAHFFHHFESGRCFLTVHDAHVAVAMQHKPDVQIVTS